MFYLCHKQTHIWKLFLYYIYYMYFSTDVGKTTDRVLMTHPLQTVIKLSFVANVSKSFRVHCFACWTSPEVILFSGCFHLLQDPGYRIWSLASHAKCSVSAGTWYWQLHFLAVLGKHLPVKTSICRSSRGSAIAVITRHTQSGARPRALPLTLPSPCSCEPWPEPL